MKILPPSDAPKRVRVSAYLMWGVLAAGVVIRFAFFDAQTTQLQKPFWLTAIGVALHGYFIVGISNGRNSARWVYPFLLLFGILAMPPSLFDPFDVLPLAVQCAALVALFTGDANAWFRRKAVPA